MIRLENNIRALRHRKGPTQEQSADALSCSPQAVSKWEVGAGYPDVATLPVLAGYFGVSLDELFDYDPQETEQKIHALLIRSRVEATTFVQKGTAAARGHCYLPRRGFAQTGAVGAIRPANL